MDVFKLDSFQAVFLSLEALYKNKYYNVSHWDRDEFKMMDMGETTKIYGNIRDRKYFFLIMHEEK